MVQLLAYLIIVQEVPDSFSVIARKCYISGIRAMAQLVETTSKYMFRTNHDENFGEDG